MLTIQPLQDWKEGATGFFDMDEKTYRRAPGLSQSLLKLALRSPQHVRQSLRCPMEASADMELGTLAHCLILTPDQFGDGLSHVNQPKEYPSEAKKGEVIMKPWHGGASFCKAWKEENEDKIVLTPRQEKVIHNMADAFAFDELGASLLADGHKEVSAFYVDEESGLMLKGRFDLFAEVTDGTYLIADLKKVGREDDDSFVKTCEKLNYPFQHWQYRWLVSKIQGCDIEQVQFLHATSPDKAPHCVSWHEFDEATKRTAERNFRKAINAYADAKKSGKWTKINSTGMRDWWHNQ